MKPIALSGFIIVIIFIGISAGSLLLRLPKPEITTIGATIPMGPTVIPTPSLPKNCNSGTQTIGEIVNLTNLERSKAGLKPLVNDARLNQSALMKANDMLAKDYWAHTSPIGNEPWYWFQQVKYYYVLAGENLAKDYTYSIDVMAGWMNSTGHRTNILKPEYEDIGVAVVCGRISGLNTTLVVAHYGK